MRKRAISAALATLAGAAVLATRDEWPEWTAGGARAQAGDALPAIAGPALRRSSPAAILCRGDSNVRGSGGTRPWGRSAPVRPWCDWLAQAMGARAINRGVGGDTVAMGLARGGSDAAADMVILLYGANDAAVRGLFGGRRPTGTEAFKAALGRLIRQHGAGRVVVLAPLPAGSRAAERRLAPYRRAAYAVARTEGAAFLDPSPALGGKAVLDRDGLHLNAAGHRQLGLWLAEQLDKRAKGAIAP